MPPKSKARLLLLATALLWGATFTLVKSVLTDISPLLFNLLRFLLAAATLAFLNRKHLRTLTRAHLKAGAIAGFFLAAGYQFQTLGLAHTSPANSAFITSIIVIIVPAFTLVPALRPASTKRPGLPALAAAVLAFAGLLFLTTPPGAAPQSMSRLANLHLGDLLTLVCAVAFAAHLLSLTRFAPTMPAGLLATLQVTFAAAFMLLTEPLEFLRGQRPHAHFTPAVLVTIALCAFFATAAAFTVQTYAQQHLAPTETILILILEPVFGALTAMFFLHQTLTARTLLGAALILAGILLAELLPATHTTEIPA